MGSLQLRVVGSGLGVPSRGSPFVVLERAGAEILSFLLPDRITVLENYREKILVLALSLGIFVITENRVKDFAVGESALPGNPQAREIT